MGEEKPETQVKYLDAMQEAFHNGDYGTVVQLTTELQEITRAEHMDAQTRRGLGLDTERIRINRLFESLGLPIEDPLETLKALDLIISTVKMIKENEEFLGGKRWVQ